MLFTRTQLLKNITGNYLAKVNIGSEQFSKKVRIETIKPNRLKISLDLPERIPADTKNTEIPIEVKWLHGAPAKNLKANVQVALTQTKTNFEGFETYSFDDPTLKVKSKEEIIFDGQLDESGKGIIKPKIKIDKNQAPGMLQANFIIKAFENSGDFSIDRSSTKVSPFQEYVGIKVPKGKGWRGSLHYNKDISMPLVTLDEAGNKTSVEGLQVEVYDLEWRWWWEQKGDLTKFRNRKSLRPIFNAEVNTRNGIGQFTIPANTLDWNRYLVITKHPESGHRTGKVFYASYDWRSRRQNGKNKDAANMLVFSTDKEEYSLGEEIQVSIPTAAEGKILVTVETGSNLIESFWLDAKKGNTAVNISTSADMSPTAYITATYVQPHANTSNDLPIRMFGVTPVRVENKASHLSPILVMNDELAPNEKVELTVSEQEGQEMFYTVAIVDEGILDLTHFKTPDVWSVFNAKEALGVKTWDMYKYVMGADVSKMANLLAIGGDGEAGQSPENKKGQSI